jgi:hypothetical protein
MKSKWYRAIFWYFIIVFLYICMYMLYECILSNAEGTYIIAINYQLLTIIALVIINTKWIIGEWKGKNNIYYHVAELISYMLFATFPGIVIYENTVGVVIHGLITYIVMVLVISLYFRIKATRAEV